VKIFFSSWAVLSLELLFSFSNLYANIEDHGFSGTKSCLADPLTGKVYDPSTHGRGGNPRGEFFEPRSQKGLSNRFLLNAWVTAHVTDGGSPIEHSARIQRPAAYAEVSIRNFQDELNGLADFFGNFFAFVSSRTGTVASDYFSHFIRVYSLSDTGTETEEYAGLTLGKHRVEVPWSFPSLNPNIQLGSDRTGAVTTETLAAGNTYVHMAEEFAWIRSFDELSNFQFLPAFNSVTNVPMMPCNAFYSREYNRLVLMAGRGQCPNTAYSTIIRHEGGHAFLFSLGIADPTLVDDFYSLHEGVSDTIAALSLDDPCIGNDLFGLKSGCGRNIAATNYQWQPGAQDEPHTEGLAFAGAFWKIHSELKQRFGQLEGSEISKSLFLKSVLLIAEHHTGLNPAMTVDVLEADFLLYNGAHQELIIQSFAAHNL